MPIPESQLETWSHQGAVTTAKVTHESVRHALSASTSPVRDKNFEVYLQGSYKNSTNIRGDSDVDIVVQLNSTFQGNIGRLTEEEKRLYEVAYDDATYLWRDFRADVLQALRTYYGAGVVSGGNKALKVARGSNRLPADVVVCLQHRKYQRFRSQSDQRYIEGISFYTIKENRRIINFPKSHYDNGVQKNKDDRTNGWYKTTVRIFKNARTYLVNHDVILEDLAPSYFLECLIYKVPDEKFGGSYQDTFWDVLDWLSEADLESFLCQNEQLPLFDGTDEQWSVGNAQLLIEELIHLWDNW